MQNNKPRKKFTSAITNTIFQSTLTLNIRLEANLKNVYVYFFKGKEGA